MRVFYGFDNLPVFRFPVVTVGSYDGVHAGHRELIGRINRVAAERGGESVVITFSPHPRIVLGQGEGLLLLNTLKEKILLLESAGVQNLIVAPFTEAFSHVPSSDFVRDYLVGKVGVGTLVAGYNHHFGYRKEGDFNMLPALGEQLGFGIYVVPRQDVGRDKVSSTVIRGLIGRGEMAAAARYLAHPYFMVVHRGPDGRIVSDEAAKLLPPAGTYPVMVMAQGQQWPDELLIGAGQGPSVNNLCSEPGAVPGEGKWHERAANTTEESKGCVDELVRSSLLRLPTAERIPAGTDFTVTFR